jgi:hypothetical protein
MSSCSALTRSRGTGRWIVNPLDNTITVLALEGERYAEHGVFHRGDRALSKLLDGFNIDVSEVLDAR